MKYDLINDKEKQLARNYLDKLCESNSKIEIRKFHGKRFEKDFQQMGFMKNEDDIKYIRDQCKKYGK